MKSKKDRIIEIAVVVLALVGAVVLISQISKEVNEDNALLEELEYYAQLSD